MTNEEKAHNLLTNYIQKCQVRSSRALHSYHDTRSKKSTDLFGIKTEQIYLDTHKKIISFNRKLAKIEQNFALPIIQGASQMCRDLQLKVSSNYAMKQMKFLTTQIKNVTKSIYDYASKLAKLLALPVHIVMDIANGIINAVNGIVATLKAIVAGTIGRFMGTIKAILNSIVGRINGLINSAIDLVNAPINAINSTIDGINNLISLPFDFYAKLEKSLSSTCRYIQANIPTDAGALVPNLKALVFTPTSKIIIPKIKITPDINVSIKFKPNPLAKMFGISLSLIPKISFKIIAEPIPTDFKAEYGKIQAKVNKAGFTQISDSTPGNVRKIELHPSGTYTSMLDDGSYYTKTIGDKQEITNGNWLITTSKDKVEIVAGDNKIEIRGDHLSNIAGDAGSNIVGDREDVVWGDTYDDYKGSYVGKVFADYFEVVGNDKTELTYGTLDEEIFMDHKETVWGGLTVTVFGNINIICMSNTNITTTQKTNITTGTDTNITTGKNTNVKSGASISVVAGGNLDATVAGGTTIKSGGNVDITAIAGGTTIKSGINTSIQSTGNATITAPSVDINSSMVNIGRGGMVRLG